MTTTSRTAVSRPLTAWSSTDFLDAQAVATRNEENTEVVTDAVLNEDLLDVWEVFKSDLRQSGLLDLDPNGLNLEDAEIHRACRMSRCFRVNVRDVTLWPRGAAVKIGTSEGTEQFTIPWLFLNPQTRDAYCSTMIESVRTLAAQEAWGHSATPLADADERAADEAELARLAAKLGKRVV